MRQANENTSVNLKLVMLFDWRKQIYILGHKKVNLAMDVYDRTDVGDFVQPLTFVVNELFPSCSPAGAPR
jgi:hypothetical protein